MMSKLSSWPPLARSLLSSGAASASLTNALVSWSTRRRDAQDSFVVRPRHTDTRWAPDAKTSGADRGHHSLHHLFLYYKYEKDQPAGAILKFVINKYMEHYFPAGGRVA